MKATQSQVTLRDIILATFLFATSFALLVYVRRGSEVQGLLLMYFPVALCAAVGAVFGRAIAGAWVGFALLFFLGVAAAILGPGW